jgi:internalin A
MAQNVPEALRRIAEAARTNAISLNLAGLELESLPESLRDLTHLVRLDLSGNNLVALPDWLSNFSSLTTLNLTDAQLTELPDSLGNLTELTDLNLEGNELTELPDWLGNLLGLLILSVGGNELTELPDSLGNLTDLFALYVGGNVGLVSPPPEICAAGKTAMPAFLRALQEGGEEQWFSKMVVVGEAAVGKTSVTKAVPAGWTSTRRNRRPMACTSTR